MVDERTADLIHAELDGVLSDAERAELEQRLAASPEARALRDQFARMAAALERMPQAQAPEGLEAAIAQRVASHAPRSNVVELGARRAPRRDLSRVGFALAAGVALGAVGLVAFQELQSPGSAGIAGIRGTEEGTQIAGIRGIDAAEMAGTMVRGAADEVELAVLVIDRPEVEGTATLYEGDGVLVLQFDLESGAAIEVEADYASTSLRLMGFAQGAVEDANITSESGRVGYINHGEQRFSMYLHRNTPEGGQVRLSFRQGGSLVHEATLDIPAEQARP